jgi:hypothetical protein
MGPLGFGTNEYVLARNGQCIEWGDTINSPKLTENDPWQFDIVVANLLFAG